MEKKGQIAIFVIIALVIVGVILVIYAYPQISKLVAPSEFSPKQFLQNCIQPDVRTAVQLLAKQGGSANPEAFINYFGDKVTYACYASGYYKTCIVQQPLLISSFANEISRTLKPKADGCMRSLITTYEGNGYSVKSSGINSSIILAPGKIIVNFVAPITITKADVTRSFDSFDISVESGIYDLLAISTSIIDYEATYGDSETTLYMQYYPNLKIDKKRLEDGIKVYQVSDVTTGELFQFATRSLVWPPGYGL